MRKSTIPAKTTDKSAKTVNALTDLINKSISVNCLNKDSKPIDLIRALALYVNSDACKDKSSIQVWNDITVITNAFTKLINSK